MIRWIVLALAVWALWWWTRRRPLQRRAAERDPFAVLELARDASREEITRAYREQIKLYHPDRVADLGEEIRRVAHARTVEIQRAYEELTKDR